eukprot:1016144-Prymnesium_polylepis.1
MSLSEPALRHGRLRRVQPPRPPPREGRSARMPAREAPCTQPPATPSTTETAAHRSTNLQHCTLHLQRSFLS